LILFSGSRLVRANLPGEKKCYLSIFFKFVPETFVPDSFSFGLQSAMQDPLVEDDDGKKIVELVLLIFSLVVILCMYHVCSHASNVTHPIRVENTATESGQERVDNQPQRVAPEQAYIV
tara:strand:- start:9171 stop:9527 length:357 start_codon:yes stop_codon:yes gene_type:complete